MVWVWSTVTQISAHFIGKPQLQGIIDFTVLRHLGTLYTCVCIQNNWESYILRSQVHKEWRRGACRLEMTNQILESRIVCVRNFVQFEIGNRQQKEREKEAW